MRAQLIALLMASATVVVAGPGSAENWTAPQPRQIAGQSATVPLSQLVDSYPTVPTSSTITRLREPSRMLRRQTER